MDCTAPCDVTYRKQIVQSCCDALEDRGFTRFREDEVDWPLANGFHCWVGLDSETQKGDLQINPQIGVHVIAIEKLCSQLKLGNDCGSYSRSQATYAIPMWRIVPDEHVFRFTRQTDVAAEAKRLASLYVTIGLPYARSLASYARLLPRLRDRVPLLDANPERVASCLYLMGRKDEARSFVEDFLKQRPEYFGRFAEPFLKLLPP